MLCSFLGVRWHPLFSARRDAAVSKSSGSHGTDCSELTFLFSPICLFRALRCILRVSMWDVAVQQNICQLAARPNTGHLWNSTAFNVTCFPFLVKLNNPVDACNISESSPLALSHHLGIPPFVCAQPRATVNAMSVVMLAISRPATYVAALHQNQAAVPALKRLMSSMMAEPNESAGQPTGLRLTPKCVAQRTDKQER